MWHWQRVNTTHTSVSWSGSQSGAICSAAFPVRRPPDVSACSFAIQSRISNSAIHPRHVPHAHVSTWDVSSPEDNSHRQRGRQGHSHRERRKKGSSHRQRGRPHTRLVHTLLPRLAHRVRRRLDDEGLGRRPQQEGVCVLEVRRLHDRLRQLQRAVRYAHWSALQAQHVPDARSVTGTRTSTPHSRTQRHNQPRTHTSTPHSRTECHDRQSASHTHERQQRDTWTSAISYFDQ